jgi:hypothetical protein
MYVRADSLQLAALHETEIREELATSNPVPPLPQYPDPLPSICLLLVPHVPEFVLDLLQHRCTEPIAADPVLGRQICSKIDRLRRVAERIRRRKEHSQVKWREVEDILDYRYKSGGGRLEGDYR